MFQVRENLVSMIDEMLNRIKQETIPVDSKFHRHIIGRSGANVNRIRSEYNVFINFDDNCIKLEGEFCILWCIAGLLWCIVGILCFIVSKEQYIIL